MITYVTGTPHLEYLAPDLYGHLDTPRDDRLDATYDDELHRYFNSVRYVDFFVKHLIEQYKKLGLYEDTIFVFYGDHGEAFQEHGLKTHGPTPYDETLQVPLIIHDPQRFQGGETVAGETPVNHLDIVPTVLDMLGYEATGAEYPGSSPLRPIPQDRTLMFNCRPDVECAASLRGYEKYIYFYGRKPDEFYDLRSDPFERDDLAGETNDEDLENRRAQFLEWRLKTMATYNDGEYLLAKHLPATRIVRGLRNESEVGGEMLRKFPDGSRGTVEGRGPKQGIASCVDGPSSRSRPVAVENTCGEG